MHHPGGHSTVHDWENPQVLGINKRRGHVPIRLHSSVLSAMEQYGLAQALVPEAALAAAPPRPLPDIPSAAGLAYPPHYRGGLRRLSGCNWTFMVGSGWRLLIRVGPPF